MNQKIYFWFLRTALLACMLFQVQATILAQDGKQAYTNFLLDKDVREFPKIDNNHKDVFQLISHGKPGYLLLDGRWRNARDIAAYLQVHHLLSPSVSHINIYGCAFGKGPEGAAAIQYLSKALKVSIAASNNITGNGGDWVLEVGNPRFALSVNNYLYNLQDFDNDGVLNANDIDADNDGILNAIENPTCFYTAAQASTITNVTTELQQRNGYFISYSFDNDLNTQSAFNENQSIVNKTIFQLTPTLPIPLKSLYVEMGSWNISYDANSTFKLQGYNGSAWLDLSAPLANTNTTSFTINNTTDTVSVFSKFRIQGIAGTCWIGGVKEFTLTTTSVYNPSLHAKSTCLVDADADSNPNYLDLDSDGDGCSDALETGATNNNAANFQFSGPVGTNGLVNSLETAPDNGILNYQGSISYVYTAAIKACKDSDSDGVYDVKDIDADNDGILNALESPGCFYTGMEAAKIVSIKSDLVPYDQVNYVAAKAIDNNINTHSAFVANQSIINKTMWEVTPTLPILAKSLDFDMGGANISYDANSKFKLQGYNGSTWVDLSAPIATTTNADFSLYNTMDSVTAFSKYRVLGVAGTCWVSDVNELSLTPTESFNSSINPKTVCSNDLDGDNIPNYLDLDSDGDGCSDALEAGATTNPAEFYKFTGPVGTNGFVDSLETVVDNGIATHYLPYLFYSQTSVVKACKDLDADGVNDVKDLDVDNDGILNAPESPGCFYTEVEAAELVTIRSDLQSWDQTNYLPKMAIDNNTNTHSAFSPNQNIANKALWEFTSNAPIPVKSVFVDMGGSNISYNTTSTFKLQGFSGSTWVDLSVPVYNVNGNDFSIINTLDTVNLYSRFRIYGVAGTCWVGDVNELSMVTGSCYVPSLNPKPVCVNDMDKDSVVNYQDLDSDGDGCSDALEAGTTTDQTTNYQFAGAVGNNGLVDSIETSPDAGVTIFTLPYLFYAYTTNVKVCKDSDNDGIADAKDIDADNDGILNASENPTCFYSPAQAADVVAVRSDLLPYDQSGSYTVDKSIDNNVNTHAAFSAGQPLANKTMWELTPAIPIPLSSVNFDMDAANISYDANSTFKLQGFNGASWIDLSGPVASTTNTDFSVYNTVDSINIYSKFRLYGIAGTCWVSDINEFTLTTAPAFSPSLNPRPNCSSDKDSDGVVNYLDLDSDGDGCSDAFESGATTNTAANYQFSGPVGINGYLDSLETAVDNGISSKYLPYLFYAYSKSIKACVDQDQDGIKDIVDIDADNDGILNASEAPSCFYTLSEASNIINVTSDLVPYDQTNYLPQFSYDKNVNTHSAFAPNQSIANRTLWEISPAIPIPLTSLNFDMGGSNISYNPSSTFKLQGFTGSTWLDLSAPTFNSNNTDFSILNTMDIVTDTTTTYATCGLSGGDVNKGTLALTLHGCLVFQGNGSQTESDTIKTCVVACSHGVCDTTYAIFAPAIKPYGVDSVFVSPAPVGSPATITCPTADDIQPGYVNPTYHNCGISAADSAFGTISFNATGCVSWTPNATQNDTIRTCVTKCADTTIGSTTYTICDTTRVFFVPVPHSDTLILKAACASCIVTACPTADDIVVTSSTVFGSCGTPFGYSVVPATSAAGCVKFTATNPASPPTDTLYTCMVACNGTTCDTTFVAFLPPVTTDTVRIAAPCKTCPVMACVVGDDVDTTGGTATYTSCSAPAGYTVTSLNGCRTYTPTTNIPVETQTCIVICNKGICDTTIVILAPPITADTTIVTANCPTCPITACVVADQIDTIGATYTSCAAPAGFTSTSSGGCYTYTPSTPYTTGTRQSCIVACKDGVCDTTIVIINPPTPVTTDTLIKMATCDTCPMSACIVVNDVDPNGATYSACGAPAGYTMTASNNCYIYTPIGVVTDTVTTCITMCNNGKCDTTLVILRPLNYTTISDTVRLRAYCGTCAVNACVSTSEVDTAGATYSSCGNPAGYSVTSANGCATYTPTGTITDTVKTCITICNNGKCDTTFVIIAPPVTSLPPDSISVTFTCDTCSAKACPSLAGIDTTGGVAYSTCGTPAGYNITGPDANGCFTITPTAPHTDTAKTCLVRCANGLCDTSYISLIPFPTHTTPDTVRLRPTCGICTVNTCVSTAEVSASGATYANCTAPAGYAVSSSGGCSTYTPTGPVTDTVKTCITICNNGKCDTTIVIIAPPITSLPPDSVSVTFNCDTCSAVACAPLSSGMDTTGGVTYTSCGAPAGYTMVGPDADGCFTITPTAPHTDTAQTCIVRCANGLCDTAYVSLMPPPPTQPLPILVTNFTGRTLQNKTNQLFWSVSNEKDMKNYAIQRSSDQKVWDNLGTIAALNKGNNPTFQMIDNNPEADNFYRLVLRNAEGALSYYDKIVYLHRTAPLADEVKVYPNPAKALINMDYNSIADRSKVVIHITDIAGRIIKTMEAEFHAGNNSLQIDINDLADGSYLIDYHNVDNGNSGKIKFVKNAQ